MGGGSNTHLVGMTGALGPGDHGLGGMMSSAMMVNGTGMMGSMAPPHAHYANSEGVSSMSSAQAAAAAQGVGNPMMSSPSVMNGPLQMAQTPVIPSSQYHQQQIIAHQRSRAAATPHHHARTAMALQRQQANYVGSSTFDPAHMTSGTPVSNYADFLSGRSTTPLGHMNGQGSTPAIIRPPSTRAKSTSIGSANDRRTPGATTYYSGANSNLPPMSTPVQQSSAVAKSGPRWTELDLGGMNLRAISSPLF
ncbi:hypothetical protein GGI21_006352, partial [Coemansia aciculifera]